MTSRPRFVRRAGALFAKASAGGALAISLALAMASSADAAGGGYGPTPPSNGAPGGFTTVVASKQIGPAGGSLTATVDGKTVTINVPAGSLSSTDDLVVTAPDLVSMQAALGSLGYPGFTAVAGVGLNILDASGSKVTTSFSPPIRVTVNGSGLGVPGEKVLSLTGPGSATALTAAPGTNAVTIDITADPNLAVINPPATTGTVTGTVPGATTQSTGKPFTGERDLAVGLGALGVLAIAAGVLRRRSAAAARD